jgi:hypothetical protein
MDISRFQEQLNDPANSRQDLLTMRENAIRKGEREFARVAEDTLDKRFPGWNQVRSRRGRVTPTDVRFFAERRHFGTAKEAYVWLIERFVQHYPKPFVDLDWETIFLAKGPRAVFFARSLGKLSGEKEHLADDPNKYQRLTNGWFANSFSATSRRLKSCSSLDLLHISSSDEIGIGMT